MKTSACTDSCTEGIWSAPGRCLHAIQCEIGGHLERENESHRSSSYGVSGGVSAIYNTYWEMRNQMIIIQDHCMSFQFSISDKKESRLLTCDWCTFYISSAETSWRADHVSLDKTLPHQARCLMMGLCSRNLIGWPQVQLGSHWPRRWFHSPGQRN